MIADGSDGPRPRDDPTPSYGMRPYREDPRRAIMDAFFDLSLRATSGEMRSIERWFRRSVARGEIPAGLAIADVLDLELRRLRVGRCPFCNGRSWKPKPHRGRNDRMRCLDLENRHRLCLTCHGGVDAGLLIVTGPTDAPSFWTQDGRRIEIRRR